MISYKYIKYTFSRTRWVVDMVRTGAIYVLVFLGISFKWRTAEGTNISTGIFGAITVTEVWMPLQPGCGSRAS